MLNSSQTLAISVVLATIGMVVPQLSVAAGGILSIAFDFYCYFTSKSKIRR